MPVWKLVKARRYGQLFYYQDKYHSEIPIAKLAAIVGASKGINKGDLFVFADQFDDLNTDPGQYDQTLANTWTSLLKDRRFRTWSQDVVPENLDNKLQRMSESSPIAKPRAYMSPRIILVCPEFRHGKLRVGMALLTRKTKKFEDIYDFDTGERIGKIETLTEGSDICRMGGSFTLITEEEERTIKDMGLDLL